jgi:hypothetical protein
MRELGSILANTRNWGDWVAQGPRSYEHHVSRHRLALGPVPDKEGLFCDMAPARGACDLAREPLADT